MERLCQQIAAQPLAAATLVQILRASLDADISAALLRESLAYSTLQFSQGFQTWRASQPPPIVVEEAEPLRLQRKDDVLNVTFNRPAVHNAYSTQLRDAFCSALQLAHDDRSLRHVRVAGEGPSFCAGGDLSEFGAVTDAGLAHLSRTTRSAGYLVATAPIEVSFQLHGACIGAGIELPAFSDNIGAREDSFFQLPEVSFGLVPGAGGTVSIPRRIGRHRTAYLAISNQPVSAPTALEWGLIDTLS